MARVPTQRPPAKTAAPAGACQTMPDVDLQVILETGKTSLTCKDGSPYLPEAR